MLNRRRRHQTPTFLEGTPGFYVKRESPPRVPGTAPIPTKADVISGCSGSGSHSNASRSLSSSRSSLLQPSTNCFAPKTTPMGACGASTPALVASALYSSATSIATTVGNIGILSADCSSTATPCTSGFGQPSSNFSSMQNFSGLQQQAFHNDHRRNVTGRRLSHTPIRPNRRAAPRYELSSHSFNNSPSSWTSAKNFAVSSTGGSSAIALNTCNENVDSNILQRGNLSNDAGILDGFRGFERQNLATSLSFGNVVESFSDDDLIQNIDGQEMMNERNNVMHKTSINMPNSSPNTQIGNVWQRTSISSSSGIMVNGTTNGAGAVSSTSMQSLPGSSILQDQVGSSSNTVSAIPGIPANGNVADPEADLPLPPNWEVEVTPEGIRYYVDHDHRRTHWIHPLAVENLSPGWIKIFDQAHGVVYYNETEQRSQFEHPGLATSAPLQFNQVTTQFSNEYGTPYKISNSNHPQIPEECAVDPASTNFVEDFNIIDDRDVPEWIRLYSEAPFESDHLLNWEVFDLAQLEEFDQMLMKLFKQDAINTVIKYERPRREINNELAHRSVVT